MSGTDVDMSGTDADMVLRRASSRSTSASTRQKGSPAVLWASMPLKAQEMSQETMIGSTRTRTALAWRSCTPEARGTGRTPSGVGPEGL